MNPQPKQPSPGIVKMAIAVNQFATPGLGSLIARRWLAGAGQLTLAVTGFCFFIAWFVRIMAQFYGTVDGSTEVKPVGWMAWTGLISFGASWIWALVTSIGLWRELSRQQEAESLERFKR